MKEESQKKILSSWKSWKIMKAFPFCPWRVGTGGSLKSLATQSSQWFNPFCYPSSFLSTSHIYQLDDSLLYLFQLLVYLLSKHKPPNWVQYPGSISQLPSQHPPPCWGLIFLWVCPRWHFPASVQPCTAALPSPLGTSTGYFLAVLPSSGKGGGCTCIFYHLSSVGSRMRYPQCIQN